MVNPSSKTCRDSAPAHGVDFSLETHCILKSIERACVGTWKRLDVVIKRWNSRRSVDHIHGVMKVH